MKEDVWRYYRQSEVTRVARDCFILGFVVGAALSAGVFLLVLLLMHRL